MTIDKLYYSTRRDFEEDCSNTVNEIIDKVNGLPAAADVAEAVRNSGRLLNVGLYTPALEDVDVSGITVTPSQTALAQTTEDRKFLDNQSLYSVSNNSYVEDYFGSARLKTLTLPSGTGNITDYAAEGASQIYAAYTVITDAQYISFKMTKGAACNLIVDGKYTSKTNYTLPNIASSEFLNVSFASRKIRELTLQFPPSNKAFRGAFLVPLDTIYQPPLKTKAVAFGDSFAEGLTSSDAGISWPYILGDYFNLNIMPSCKSGTGFYRSAGFYNYLERASDAADSNAEVVFACSTVNDTGYDQALVQANVLSWYQQVRSDLPNAKIVVIGSAGALVSYTQTNEQNVRNVIDGLGDDNVIFVPVMTDPNPPITGTGNVSAPAGNGNADLYVTSDGHFNQAGHIFYSKWVATKLASLNFL